MSEHTHTAPGFDRVGAITLFVDDLARSRVWYVQAFDRPVEFEDDVSVVFRFENTLVNLLHRSAAHELVHPAPVAGAGSPSPFQLTIWVDDVDRAIADLAGRGIAALNGPIDRPWGQRTACLADPDGHVWELAQPIG